MLSPKDADSFARSVGEAAHLLVTEARFGEDEHQLVAQMLVNFPGPTLLGDWEVTGTFRLLTIKCADGAHLIYILRSGEELPQDAVNSLKATAAPLGDERPWKVKLEQDWAGVACLKEVDTDSERLVVNACLGS